MSTVPSVTIIVRTSCAPDRIASLHRVVQSVLAQPSVDAEVLLVYNGTAGDPQTLDALGAIPGVRLAYQDRGHAGEAMLTGRLLVTRPYFGFIDDDDELLPNTLAARVAAFEDPSVDVVVTNGYRHRDGQDTPMFPSMQEARDDPFQTAFGQTWLSNCAGLFRTATITARMFSDLPRYYEWLIIATRILDWQHRCAFLDLYAYRLYVTTGSVSTTEAFVTAEVEVLAQLWSQTTHPKVRYFLRRSLANAWHTRADAALINGDHAEAWRAHFKSLSTPSGWRYLPFTRRLL